LAIAKLNLSVTLQTVTDAQHRGPRAWGIEARDGVELIAEWRHMRTGSQRRTDVLGESSKKRNAANASQH
jgi:hypothetical protein